MKNLALLIPVLALSLAACSEETTPQPVPTVKAEAVPAAPATPSLPAPDQAVFSAALAEACPSAKPVHTAVCRRAGLGSEDAICDFGLGDDQYLRNKATLTPGEGKWVLADPATVCAASAK